MPLPAILAAALPSLISGAASVAGGILSKPKRQRETPIQKRQRQTIDEVLAGLRGEGDFAQFFGADEDVFQRQFVDPALQRFQSQVAPQIQQSFIASGQQRGTGLEDALTRAGVDLNTALASQFGEFQQAGQNRAMQALNQVLGAGPGFQPSGGRETAQAFGGLLSSDLIQDLLDAFTGQESTSPSSAAVPALGDTVPRAGGEGRFGLPQFRTDLPFRRGFSQ